MATQLKHTDSRPIPVPAREAYRGLYPAHRPNVRVAFLPGEAAMAVRDRLSDRTDATSTLDQIAPPVIGRDPYPLPLAGLAVSPVLASLIERYTQAYHGEGGEDCARVWAGISREIAAFAPRSAADTAAKLMMGLHYLHPADKLEPTPTLAFDTEDCACDGAAEMLIASMNEMVAAAHASAVRPPFDAWSKAQLAFERAEAAMEADTSEDWDACKELFNREYDLRIALYMTPAPTAAELAYKLALYNRTEARYLNIAAEIGKVLEADARRLAAVPVATDDQWSAALAAFETVTVSLRQPGLTDEQVDNLAKIEWDAGHAVTALRSRTIADVLTKLRIQMRLAVMIEHDDLAPVLVDLARFAGVDLAEQGA